MKLFDEIIRFCRNSINKPDSVSYEPGEGSLATNEVDRPSSDYPCSDKAIKEQLIKFYVEGNPVNLVDRDELFYKAAEFVVLTQICSISAIQREFAVGLGRARNLLDQLESAGIISQHRTNEGRRVLIKEEYSLRELISSLPHIELNNCLDQLDTFYEKYKEEIEKRRNDTKLLQLEELKKTETEVLMLIKLEKILQKRLPETTRADRHKQAYKL